MRAIISDIRETWSNLGNDLSRLFFILMPSHPVESGDTSLNFTRLACEDVANNDSNVIFVNLATLSNYLEINSLGLYHSSGTSHLKQNGYIYLSELVWDYLLGPRITDYRISNVGNSSIVYNARAYPKTLLFQTDLTSNQTITLNTNEARQGDTLRVVRTGLGNYTLDVGGLKTIPSATAAWCDVQFTGTEWVLTGYGTL